MFGNQPIERIHAAMAAAWDTQESIRRANELKNRFHIQAKLNVDRYTALQEFLRRRSMNMNSGLNYLIDTHPEING